MNYFITKQDDGSVNIVTPVPPKFDLFTGEYLLLEEIPELLEGKKYSLNDGELSVINKTTADLNLDDTKKLESDLKGIDQETNSTIESGFTFDNLVFSLSKNAQLNWGNLFILKQAGLYTDTEIATIDSNVFMLTTGNVNAFFAAYTDALNATLEIGRNLKQILKNN